MEVWDPAELPKAWGLLGRGSFQLVGALFSHDGRANPLPQVAAPAAATALKQLGLHNIQSAADVTEDNIDKVSGQGGVGWDGRSACGVAVR